ncbi:MAG: NgoMIV family type II restriction endonuclease [Paracoccus sp. (in: a-proteobacteria)]|uniref:NgoMIV family type II restriction endonuclease n=1 Tax=Paracoccus sp. TaxID=267 RepID=UPI0026DFCA76|nr:NgoMIV family type II restriction endonuclease [Paracoccus sp. (in: a-proteobacteria)]MDO5622991.1 NgoMIV family type II restriction endonuclease [Paracoccus sp. (in: a-proteobacteria)]
MPEVIGPRALFREAREQFHADLLQTVLTVNAQGVWTNADKDSRASCVISARMAELLRAETVAERLAGQTSGRRFEELVAAFVRSTFCPLNHLRPGQWAVEQISGRGRVETLARFAQFSHLRAIAEAVRGNVQLAAAIGNEYAIKPDVVVYRGPESDDAINAPGLIVDDELATRAPLRASFNQQPILHASISCKWTMRSDRSQNARSEALNLIRHRKGTVPHIVAVVAEPMPSRISSVALGTGDLDCVYHFALYELQQAVQEVGSEDAQETLQIMVEGGRLKDISDLPLDLAV